MRGTRERRDPVVTPGAAFGYYRMARGWMDHPVFGNQPFSRREAWVWLIEEAAWQPHSRDVKGRTIELKRGQLVHSIRFIARAWRWDKAAVSRYLTRLNTETMIETATDTGVTVTTICNYDKYQAPINQTETPPDTDGDTKVRQQRDRSETDENKQQPIPSSNTSTESSLTDSEPSVERGAQDAPDDNLELPSFLDKRKTNGSGEAYAWTGRIVRLTSADLDQWRTNYPNVPDLEAELQKADDYYADNPPPNGKWFFPVSKWLERAHRDHSSNKDPRTDPAYWDDKP